MELIAKKYRVLKTLGHGAMGDVFLVLPPRGDPVALKLLKTMESKEDSNALSQFENEFKVLKKLAHPNIGRIYDYGYDEESAKVFFTLPWLKGTDIYQYTKNFTFEECEALFVQTLRAINYLHQKGIFHCDLKPGNIYIENGKALLIDFGLAGYFGEFIVGTPTYLAPEIYQGGKHNITSDLYALGVIFYNCLTRTQPFSGKTLQEVYDRHRTLTLPALYEVNPKVPKYFSDIVATLLNKKPKERFPDAASVIEEISAFSKKDYPIETEETLLSYLPAQSELIGRKEILLEIQSVLNDFLSDSQKKPFHVIFIHGKKNVGKSKIVQKIKNDLQLTKISVETALPPFEEENAKLLLSSKAIVFENIDSYFESGDEEKNLKQFQDVLEHKMIAPETTRFLFLGTSEEVSHFESFEKLFPQESTQFITIELLPYTKDEMKEFLVSVIGQKEIPKIFLDQFYANTNGFPGIAQELIQSMIEKGLLFDKSGRWNEDLLTELDKAFDCLEISASLEHEFEKTYNSLDETEEEIVKWLSLCPHPLTGEQLEMLINKKNLNEPVEKYRDPRGDPEVVLFSPLGEKIPDRVRTTMGDVFQQALNKILESMTQKNILRKETEGYGLYRKIFQNFIKENLPEKDVQERHNALARIKVNLPKKWGAYHLSHGSDKGLAKKATEKLAKIYQQEGDREKAAETYLRLLDDYKTDSAVLKISWAIEASQLLIELDRFQAAYNTLDNIEKEIQKTSAPVKSEKLLIVIEKKGLALLHMQDIEKARFYFQNGLKFSKKYSDLKVQQFRFENNLAEIELVIGHHEKAIEIFKRTREMSQNLSFQDLQILTNNDLGHVYLMKNDYKKSIKILAEDMKIFSTLPNKEPLARALYSYAQALQMLKHNDKTVLAYEECIRLCKEGHFLPLLLRAYNGLGNLYVTLEDFPKALENYQKALELSVRLNDTTSKAALLFNQGFIYRNQKNIALAVRRFSLAIQVLEYKKKKLAYDISLLSRCYNALGIISFEEENHPMKALSYFLERKNLAETTAASREERFQISHSLAEIYLKLRFEEKFQNEFKTLNELAQTDSEKENLIKLKQEWDAVKNLDPQEETGKINLAENEHGI